jgi:hypothetical protein
MVLTYFLNDFEMVPVAPIYYYYYYYHLSLLSPNSLLNTWFSDTAGCVPSESELYSYVLQEPSVVNFGYFNFNLFKTVLYKLLQNW